MSDFRFSLRAVLICLSVAAVPLPTQAAQPAYKIGDRLNGSPANAAPEFRTIKWENLIPKGWHPADAFKGLDVSRLQDSDPRAMDALDRMREAWTSAPVEMSLNGASVRIAGFVIPLERAKDEVREFLLVPYFGACIHVPPPPPNQIIYVVADKPIKNVMTMDTMWVSGVLTVKSSDSDWGHAAYQLRATLTAPYVLPTGK